MSALALPRTDLGIVSIRSSVSISMISVMHILMNTILIISKLSIIVMISSSITIDLTVSIGCTSMRTSRSKNPSGKSP